MNRVFETIIVLVLLLGSIILHELAHGVVAYWLGDRTAKESGRLTLNPLKHLDLGMSLVVPVVLFLMGMPVMGGAKPVPVNSRNLKFKEWGMALVALAGPLMNFLLAFVLFMVYYWTGSGIAFQAMTVNLSLMLFNLIPIPPLDGSRVIYAIAPDMVREWLLKVENYGILIVYGLVLVFGGVLSNLMFDGMNGIYQFFRFIVGI